MDMQNPRHNLTPNRLLLPALLACYFIWGSTYLAIRIALPSFPPFFQMATRFLAAGGLLMAWLCVRGQTLPTRTEWRNAALISVLMLGGGMGLTAQASVHIGSGLIATFIAVVPMMTCGWGLLFGQRPSRLELIGMLTGLAGVCVLVQGASFSAAPLGLLCIIGATLSWSLGSVLSTTRLPLTKGPMGFASQMLCGGVALLLASQLLGEHMVWPPTLEASAAWLYLVLAGSLVAFSAYMYLLAHASSAVATSYAFVNPLIALFLGVVLAGEVVMPKEWLACGIILLGVVFILVAGQKSPKH
jgi:drug/metabolite transporter (DMT)-like permease